MKEFLIFFLLLSAHLASGEIDVSGADAIRNASLVQADINTTRQPVSSILIYNENGNDSISLEAAQIPTSTIALSRIFTWDDVSKNTWPLQLGNIPSAKKQLRHIFIVHEFASNQKSLAYPHELFQDTKPPAIANIAIKDNMSNEATINWTTDEFATSLVKYSNTPGAYDLKESDALYTINHSLALHGLLPEARYYLVVNSTDRSKNSAESRSLEFQTSRL
jgi:hypothetical protein